MLLKTAERAQYPSRLWEYIKLPSKKLEAKHLIKDKLQFMSKFLNEGVMKRYIKMLEVKARMRKLKLKDKFDLFLFLNVFLEKQQ